MPLKEIPPHVIRILPFNLFPEENVLALDLLPAVRTDMFLLHHLLAPFSPIDPVGQSPTLIANICPAFREGSVTIFPSLSCKPS